MIKDILKITAIIAFFTLLGYALTFPYEVKIKNKDIILIEDMYGNKYKTLSNILNYTDLKNKILCIVDTKFALRNLKNGEKRETYYTNKLNKLYDKYKDKNVQFIYLYYLENSPFFNLESNRKKDHIRKWKGFVKKHSVKGYHFFTNYILKNNIQDKSKNIDKMYNIVYYPSYILVTPLGEIKDASKVYTPNKNIIEELNSLLNTRNNDTIISK